ncbi:hypothetical protein BFP72_07120 [Reichenbachiella sp. 5M10]|uniref:hypothetical protein n=1 Tax=Reichenbachiella sp. 5M10 TaxID=1889772 RepID=UPI000C153567|nr:hypothetical protein [Reichenbachiella sp. 5M10]PIB35182.1 hypothetical protein BFP72_07120 [Reichenbachiella sp. 5M10]
MSVIRIRKIGLLAILGATVIAEIIANLPESEDPGLYGVVQLYWPLINGAVVLCIFMLITFVLKRERVLMYVLYACVLYLIYVGVYTRFF